MSPYPAAAFLMVALSASSPHGSTAAHALPDDGWPLADCSFDGCRISQSQFDLLRVGMTLKEVTTLMGCEGSVEDSSTSFEEHTQIVRFSGAKSGTGAFIKMINGVIHDKISIGLNDR